VKSALYGQDHNLPLFGYITGLGGRDITPENFKEIARLTMAKDKPEEDITWIGVKR